MNKFISKMISTFVPGVSKWRCFCYQTSCC